MEKFYNEEIGSSSNKHIHKKYTVFVFDKLKSTNTTLKRMAELGANEGTIVIANKQSEGRGTQGRKFFSPENGIYISMLMRPKFDVKKSLNITISTAVAVAQAIRTITGIKCGIKWVNDIFYNNKKVGGILTEAHFNKESNSFDYIVVGVGLNLAKTKENFPDDIANIAGYLYNKEVSNEVRNNLMMKIVYNTYKLYNQLKFKTHVKKYSKLLILKNKNIKFEYNREIFIGKAVGVDRFGRLLIVKNHRKLKLSAGEVRLVR